MSTTRTFNLELVVLIVIQNLCWDGEGGADDKFITLVVKMVYSKISAFSRWYCSIASRRHLAVHHFHNKDN